MLRLLNIIALAFALLQGTSGSLHGSINSVIAGNLKSALFGNGISTTYDYNSRHHLRRMRTVNGAQTMLANFDYDGAGSDASAVAGSWGIQSLSKSGRRNRMDENVNGTLRSILYGYDELNRLTKEMIGGSQVVYDSAAGYADASGYDPVGNRRNRTVAGTPITALPAQTFCYDQNDQIDNDTTASTTTAHYDANGNRTSGNGATYQYDFENRLIKATLSNRVVSMVYDGDGHRVQKTVTGTDAGVTHYLVDDRNPTGYAQILEERATAQSSSPAVTYIYGLDLVSQTRSGATHYYGYDGLGTVRYLTDTGATISDTYTADAFGIEIARTGSTPNHYRYTGEQWDADLNLYYLRARYYNPSEGRFLTLDTFEGNQTDPLSLHKYLYVHANPINGVDPSGHMVGVIEAFAVNVSQMLQKQSDAARGYFIRSRVRDQVKELLEDRIVEGIYVIVVEPHLGVLVPYIGQGKDLSKRIPQSLNRLIDEFSEEAIRVVRYLPIDTSGMSSERARKFVRETAEQYVINLLAAEHDVLNQNNPVSVLRGEGRFKRHFKKVTKEWFRDLYEAMNKSRNR